MNPATWEEAAQLAADNVKRAPCWSGDVLETIECDLVALKRGDHWLGGRGGRWLWMACEAIIGSRRGDNGGQPVYKSEFEASLADVVATVITKQHDYGHQSILWGGVQGVVLRAHDKVARIRNLRARASANENEAALNEPLVDSWRDIAGYALIGYMLEVGTFELPLAADVTPGPLSCPGMAMSTYDPNAHSWSDGLARWSSSDDEDDMVDVVLTAEEEAAIIELIKPYVRDRIAEALIGHMHLYPHGRVGQYGSGA